MQLRLSELVHLLNRLAEDMPTAWVEVCSKRDGVHIHAPLEGVLVQAVNSLPKHAPEGEIRLIVEPVEESVQAKRKRIGRGQE